jgi:hypothetical protein
MSAEKIIKIEYENLSDSSGTTIVDSDTILQKKINKIFPKVDVTALLALRTEKRRRLLLFIGIPVALWGWPMVFYFQLSSQPIIHASSGYSPSISW